MLRALVVPLRAPLVHWRLALVLWLARLLPVLLAFGLPAYELAASRSAHHPDARLLLESTTDHDGFVYAWTSDFFRDAMGGASDTVFWLIVLCWLLVTVLAGGIVTRLVHGGGVRGGLFLAECGRYAGRFLRLGMLSAFVLYATDAGINAIWSARHADVAALQHTQDFALRSDWIRGLVFLIAAYLIGLLHSYARIDMVLRERRSAFLSFLRGVVAFVRHLPALLLAELGVLLAVGLAALLGWVVLKGANPLHADAGWIAVSIFLAMAAVVSFVRSGVEVGALDARCAVLAPPAAPESIVSQIEAVLGPDA